MYADIIQIQWAATDSGVLRLMSQTTSSSSSMAQTTPAQTAHRTVPNAAQTVTSTSTATPAISQGGLSTGAEAGIGIGAAIGAIGLALLGYLLWRQRKKQKSRAVGDKEAIPPQQQQHQQQQQQQYRVAHELDHEQKKYYNPDPAELPSGNAQELPADQGRSELGSDNATTRYSTFSGTTNTVSSRNPSQRLRTDRLL